MEVEAISYRVWSVGGQIIYLNKSVFTCNCKNCAYFHKHDKEPTNCQYIKELLKWLGDKRDNK